MKKYKLLSFIIYAVLTVYIYGFFDNFWNMSIFRGKPPFHFGDSSFGIWEIIRVIGPLAIFGCSWVVVDYIIKRLRKDIKKEISLKDIDSFYCVPSIVMLVYMLLKLRGAYNGIYMIADSGDYELVYKLSSVLIIPVSLMVIYLIISAIYFVISRYKRENR